MKPHILYEDNHLLVVVKPFNIPVQADISGDMDLLTFYKQYLKQTYHKPGDAYLGLVHRLDRPTGGVMNWCASYRLIRRGPSVPSCIISSCIPLRTAAHAAALCWKPGALTRSAYSLPAAAFRFWATRVMAKAGVSYAFGPRRCP